MALPRVTDCPSPNTVASLTAPKHPPIMARRPSFPALRSAHRTPTAPSFFVVLARWRDFLEAIGLSPDTTRNYRYFLLRFFGDTCLDPAEVTEDDITSYLAGLRQEGQQVRMQLRALKSFYEWGVRRGAYDVDPAAAVRFKDRKHSAAVALDPHEVTAVLEHAHARHPRRRWAILLALETGARIGSLAGVKPDEAGRNAGEFIHFRVTKGDRPYAIPLTPVAAQAIRGLLPGSNGTLMGVKKNTIWRWYHDAAIAAGLPERKRRAHILRDTFATRLLMDRGLDVRTVQELLNHADLSQMHRYAAVSDQRKLQAMATSVTDFPIGE